LTILVITAFLVILAILEIFAILVIYWYLQVSIRHDESYSNDCHMS